MLTAWLASGKLISWTFPPAVRASVTYTSPASATPASTFDGTDSTSCASLAGLSLTLVAFSIFAVAAPQGTCGAHTATVTPGLARSAKEWIFFGLPGGTTMVSTLVTNGFGVPATLPLPSTTFICASLAEANTSAGAPLTICWAKSDEPPKLNRRSALGLAASNWGFNLVNTSVREAAASTVTGTRCWPAGWLPPQPASASPAANTTVTNRFMHVLLGSRP